MLKKVSENIIELVPTSFVLFILLAGGLGTNRFFWALVLICVTLLVFVYKVIKSKVIKFPPYFKWYMLFLGTFALSLLWSKDLTASVGYFLVFLSGGLLWIFVYNFSGYFKKFDTILLILGFIFGNWVIFNYIFKIQTVSPHSLIYFANSWRNHHHIGDLWVVVMLVVVGRFQIKMHKNILWYFVFLFGFGFLLFSQSRSAYLAFMAGYLLLKKVELLKEGSIKRFYPVIIVVVVLIMITGFNKTLLFSRPYYIQALAGLTQHPFGVGVGGFKFISGDLVNHLFGMSQLSTNAHSLPVEMVSGIGVFGLVFIYWMYLIIKDAVRVKRNRAVYCAAIFVTLTVNFLFDYTYLIPTMLWIWFISLGLLQKTSSSKKL